jgi:N-carbamoylputrescine amidase
MKTPIRLALIQFNGFSDPAANVAQACELAKEAGESGADLICFHELCTIPFFAGNYNPQLLELAQPVPGPTIERISKVARDTRTVTVFPLYERDGPHRYNTAVIVGPRGDLLGKYRKMSISGSGRSDRGLEWRYCSPGNLGFPVFDTPLGIKIGILICYDRHFPEAARALALLGAEILLVPATALPAGRRWWELIFKSHAVSNLMYVGAANRVGQDQGSPAPPYYGSSILISPDGEIVARGSESDTEIVYGEVNPLKLNEVRKRYSFFFDRRPESYSIVADPKLLNATSDNSGKPGAE